MSLQNYKLTSQEYQVEDIDAFADLAYEKGWTDGMPVFPPTSKKVTEIIDYVKRRPRRGTRCRLARRGSRNH